MNRDEMLKKLADLGFDVSKVSDTTPDELLAETLKSIQAAATAKEAMDEKTEGEEEEKTEDMDEKQPETIEEKAAAYDAIMQQLETEGDDDDGQAFADAMNRAYSDLDKPELSDEDKQNLKAVLEHVAANAEGDPEDEETEMTKEEMAEMFSEGFKILRDELKAELAADAKKHTDALTAKADETKATVTKFSEEQEASSKRAMIDKFCEAEGPAGSKKIRPDELDESNQKVPSLRQQMYFADAKTVVHKYTENGKEVGMTQLDMLMESVRARKPETFSEKIPASGKPLPEDGEIAKIGAHFEQFSESFLGLGQTKEKLVEGFKVRRKMNPTVTAEEYLSV